MDKEVAVSVLIPVYNSAATLSDCLASVSGQTLDAIEILCLDDGSDEETKKVLNRCAAHDGRIRVIRHERNMGSMPARKHLMQAARGEYCMFLDSDDEYFPQACQRAYETAKRTGADIVGFGTKIVFQTGLSERERREVQKVASVYAGRLCGKEVFLSCFRYGFGECGWNLWNKIYKTEILKRAARYLPEKECTMYEDFAIYFMAAYYAQKYYGFKEPLVRYSFGHGVSGTQKWTNAEQFRKSLDRKTVCDVIENFLREEKPKASFYEREFGMWKKWMLTGILQKFTSECGLKEGTKVFDLLCEAYSIECIVSELVSLYGVEMNGRIAELVRGANCLKPRRGAIRRVGFFYHRMYNGGVERVLSELIPLFLSWGYETVLISEEKSRLDYPLPKECKRFIIPNSKNIDRTQYLRHAEKLKEVLRKADCDVLLYQATMSPWFLWDMLLAKSMGIYVAGTMHELVCLPLLRENEKGVFAARQRILQLADGVQTLVRSDAAYLRAIGCNAQFIPDPFVGEVEPVHPQGQNVVWVGRLEENQKRPSDALRIFAKVAQECPAAHLYMVGSAESEEENKRYLGLIRKLKLEERVTMCGFCKDPAEYYKKGTLLLMTSAYETWGMVLCEAMRRGLPVVCYEMPYLETLRENRGCVCVEQGNIAQAAAAVVKILKDSQLRKALSEGSLQKGKELASADLRGAWEKFFQSFGRPLEAGNENLRQGLENFLEFYELGESGAVREEDISAAELPPQPLAKKAAKYWVEHGTFALIRRAMLFVYRKMRRK